MNLLDIPLELFQLVVKELSGITILEELIPLRIVCRLFDKEVQHAFYTYPMFDKEVLSVEYYNPPLRGVEEPESEPLPKLVGLTMTKKLITCKLASSNASSRLLCSEITKTLQYLKEELGTNNTADTQELTDALITAAATHLPLRTLVDHLLPGSVNVPDKNIPFCRLEGFLEAEKFLRRALMSTNPTYALWKLQQSINYTAAAHFPLTHRGQKIIGGIFSFRGLAHNAIIELSPVALHKSLRHPVLQDGMWGVEQQRKSSALVAAIHSGNEDLTKELLKRDAEPILFNAYFGSPILGMKDSSSSAIANLIIDTELNRTPSDEFRDIRGQSQLFHLDQEFIFTCLLTTACLNNIQPLIQAIITHPAYHPSPTNTLYHRLLDHLFSPLSTSDPTLAILLLTHHPMITNPSSYPLLSTTETHLPFWTKAYEFLHAHLPETAPLIPPITSHLKKFYRPIYHNYTLNHQTERFITHLSEECELQHVETVRLLLSVARSPLASYQPALDRSFGDSKNEDFRIFDMLLEHGANIDVDGDDGLIVVVAKCGHVAALRHLLEKGADIQSQGCGMTALRRAVMSGKATRNQREIVWTLLDAGVQGSQEDWQLLRHLVAKEGCDGSIRTMVIGQINGKKVTVGEMPTDWDTWLKHI